MIKVGITGNIGSGKSTVCAIFQVLGVPVWFADVEARKLMSEDRGLRTRIVDLLGEQAYLEHSLNKEYIALKIFTNPELRKRLDAIVHPAVQQVVMGWFNSLDPITPYALEEAALLIESGGHKQLDQLIVVTAPEEVRLNRVQARDGRAPELIRKQMQAQIPQEAKVHLADFIIDNGGDRMIIPQVLEIHRKLSRTT